MSMLVRIAERALNRPLLILPDKASLILGVLEGRIPVSGPVETPATDLSPEALAALSAAPAASRFVGVASEPTEDGRGRRALPYRLTPEGVAVITVTGSLVNRGAWIGANSGLTSYEGIAHQVESARKAANVRSIILDVESAGGEAVGAMELAATVRRAASEKPVVGVVNGMAASAAYALVSGATRIVTTPTGISGSIGVVLLHADFSRRLDRDGVTPTLIFAGAHKVDGHPFAPLPEGVREDLQAEVGRFYDLFVETVAAGRPKLSPAEIRETEARTFVGREAVDRKLADDVGAFDEVLADLGGRSAARIHTPRSRTMDTTSTTPAADAASTVAKANHDAAVSAASVQATTAERSRIKTILTSEAAAARPETARHLALETDMSAEAAIALLATLPAGAPTAAVAAAAAGSRSQDAPGGLVTATGAAPDQKASAKAGWDRAFG